MWRRGCKALTRWSYRSKIFSGNSNLPGQRYQRIWSLVGGPTVETAGSVSRLMPALVQALGEIRAFHPHGVGLNGVEMCLRCLYVSISEASLCTQGGPLPKLVLRSSRLLSARSSLMATGSCRCTGRAGSGSAEGALSTTRALWSTMSAIPTWPGKNSRYFPVYLFCLICFLSGDFVIDRFDSFDSAVAPAGRMTLRAIHDLPPGMWGN